MGVDGFQIMDLNREIVQNGPETIQGPYHLGVVQKGFADIPQQGLIVGYPIV